jgi:serine/threonine-protein kinase
VAAALPGGDPLAAALAAGETPSPEMVAASGSASALSPALAVGALAISLVWLVAIAALSDRVLLTSYVPMEKPPEVLADRAREVSRALGYQDAPVDTAWGFAAAEEYLRFARERGDGGTIRGRLRTGQPAGLFFWHRASPRDLVPIGTEERVEFHNPPLTISGMRTVVLDTQGRLTEFHAVAPQRETPDSAAGPTNWTQLFSLASLDPSQFSRAAPQWTPAGHSDERAAWEGPAPGWPEHPLRIEAAAHKGRVVYFQMIYPWTEPARMQESAVSTGRQWGQAIVGLVLIGVLLAAGLIARHNVRKGRGDRRGAFRISAVVFAIAFGCWIVGAEHFATVATEVDRFFTAVGAALVGAGLLWVLYLALEPYVRKFWPKTLVSWSRLVAGNALDPRVGRDVLLGTLFGLTVVLLGRLEAHVRPALGLPQMPPQVPAMEALEGTRQMLVLVAQLVFGAMFNALWIVFGLVAVNLIVRRLWITAMVMTLFLGLTSLGQVLEAPPIWLSALFSLLTVGSIVVITLRFGLLSTAALFFVIFAMAIVPITLDTSRWFFPTGVTLLLLVAALSIYGFYASRGGEPILGRRILE